MRTVMLSGGISKSQLASITSNPLFIRVAESIVTFFPIDHVGCFSARRGVTVLSFLSGSLRKGPPDAVSIILFTSESLCPARDWKIAECSLSTGRIFRFLLLTSAIIRAPPETRASLFASATVFPAFTAAYVGRNPAQPALPGNPKMPVFSPPPPRRGPPPPPPPKKKKNFFFPRRGGKKRRDFRVPGDGGLRRVS